jgi:hypothetical protein
MNLTTFKGANPMGDRDPKNIEKLKEQAEDEKEERTDWKHETPAAREAEHDREDAEDEARIDAEVGTSAAEEG